MPGPYETLDEMPDTHLTYDHMARARGIKIITAEGSPLPEREQERLRKMHPADRADEAHFARHPVDYGLGDTRGVTTGRETWDANGGRSPNQDQMERLSGGRFRYDEDPDEGRVITDVATGRRVTADAVDRTLKRARDAEQAQPVPEGDVTDRSKNPSEVERMSRGRVRAEPGETGVIRLVDTATGLPVA